MAIIKKKIIRLSIIAVAVIGMAIIGCYIVVSGNANGKTYEMAKDVPYNKVGLLLGTSPITPQGEHNPTGHSRTLDLIPSKNDSLFLRDFYGTLHYNGLDLSSLIDESISMLDSTYYIEYTTKINGYSVKVEFRKTAGSYARLWFTDDSTTRYIFHPTFDLDDSTLKTLRIRQKNYIEYSIGENNGFNNRQLGQFNNVPFAFFDIDFDGYTELLLRHPRIGQRTLSSYSLFEESSIDPNDFKRITIYDPLDSIHTSDGITWFPAIDDCSEFDPNNNTLILWTIGGWKNKKYFYKIKYGLPHLQKIEIDTIVH